MLDKDMIKEPRLWHLVMELSSDTLYIMLFSSIEHNSLISESLPLERGVGQLKAFQNAIYDNPLLLSDFSKITILLPGERYMLIPDILSETDSRESIFRKAFSQPESGDTEEILAEELPELSTTMLTALPRDLSGFMRRTFNNPRISHTLTPLALYFKSKHTNLSRGKMIVNLRPRACDIVVLRDSAPLVMTTRPVRDPMDSVYYIMACREGLGLKPTDEIILAGDNATRGAVTPILRRFIRYVMPAILPSTMLRAGRAALRTPFEMVVAPISTGRTIKNTDIK